VLTPGLEKFDVRQLPPSPRSEQVSDASATDSGSGDGDSHSDRPVAFGSAGQPLYEAAWYREPTDAELSFYLKYTRPGPGFGMIACQTIARYHVDNCEELGETPGSGYARAVREAAWQFLVLPPRIGGRMMIGTWVRIRIDYTERKAPSP
jgi:protein TonB